VPEGQQDAGLLRVFDIYEWDRQSAFRSAAAVPGRKLSGAAGPREGTHRVLRGGSWILGGRSVRSALRFRYVPGYRYDFIGFRLAPGR
jgi:formylglycine-generating enzyme required for sulfatase activity